MKLLKALPILLLSSVSSAFASDNREDGSWFSQLARWTGENPSTLLLVFALMLMWIGLRRKLLKNPDQKQ